MGKLSKMPNIGKVLENKLVEVGIDSPEILKEVGSKEAFLRLKNCDDGVCINTLCALEGAVQGIRWHGLNDDTKKELKEFYDLLK